MGQATDGQLPADSLGYRADGIYAPGVGTIAQQGTFTGTDTQGTSYGIQTVNTGSGSVTALSGNTGLAANQPTIIQKTSGVSTGSVATLAKAFATNNTSGNSIIVTCGVGNGTNPTCADSAGNTYVRAVTGANSTTFETAIFYATNIAGGANTVTVTNAGSTASMGIQIYEVAGLITQTPSILDITSTSTGTGTAVTTPAIAPSAPNELAFLAVGVGTANEAVSVTAGTGWTLDSTTNTGGTQAGLFTFGSLSQVLSSTQAITPAATIAGSQAWTAAVATFRVVPFAVGGAVTTVASSSGGATPYHLVSLASTNATVVKAAPGKVYSVTLNCNTSAAARYLKFYDSATAPTAGSGTIVQVVQAPLLAASTGSTTVVTFPGGLQFNSGIAFVTVTTLADSGSTGVGAGDLSIDLTYS